MLPVNDTVSTKQLRSEFYNILCGYAMSLLADYPRTFDAVPKHGVVHHIPQALNASKYNSVNVGRLASRQARRVSEIYFGV